MVDFKSLFFLVFVASACRAGETLRQDLSVVRGVALGTTEIANDVLLDDRDSADWKSTFLVTDSVKTYAQIKAEIGTVRSKTRINAVTGDSLGRLFTELLVFKLIPYWYGTPWSFEGHTAVPNQGEIACGYFVSTTLLHMGVNVNRYKLAQQLPVHEAQSLALDDSIFLISHAETEEIIEEMRQVTQPGIYFLGFDQSHVGYLLNHQNQLYVIHANYVGSSGVTVERVEESAAFGSYRQFYVCPLSTNEGFMQAWQKRQLITVIETP